MLHLSSHPNAWFVRRFPLNPEIANVDTFDKKLAIASVSESRRSILVAEDKATTFSVLNLQDEKLKEVAKIKFQDLLGELGESETAATANDFKVVAWNSNDTRILVSHQKGDTNEWIIVNTSEPTKSINITKLYNKDFTKLLFANDAATNLWALTAEGELSELNTNSTAAPIAVATNVKQMINNGDTVIYVAPSKDLVFDSYGNETSSTKTTESEEDTESDIKAATDKIFVYNEGEIDSTAIADLGSANPTVILDTGTYWSKDWLVYNLNDTTERKYQSDIELTKLNWLDDFLYWQSKDKTIVVRDFNGDNRRELLSDVLEELPITISANNRYLYFFTTEEIPVITKDEAKAEEKTEETTTETTESNTPAATRPIYYLTREKLY